MGEPGFWDDNEAAQRVVGELKTLKTVVGPMADLSGAVYSSLAVFPIPMRVLASWPWRVFASNLPAMPADRRLKQSMVGSSAFAVPIEDWL